MTLIYYRTKSLLRSERFSWFLESYNGEKLARAEGFTNRSDCIHNAEVVTNLLWRTDIRVEVRW